jgi:transcription antitermination factor NusG
MQQQSKKWYAVYTKPRWEKKVDGIFLQKGLESFCPLHKVERKWSDRKKIIEDPVFKSYVFVKIKEDERLSVLETNGVLNFVNFLGKPAIVKEEEIQLIKQYLSESPLNIQVQSLNNFSVDDKVIIQKGIFMDNTGTIVKASTKKIYVRLESLGQLMVVEFPASHAALLKY